MVGKGQTVYDYIGFDEETKNGMVQFRVDVILNRGGIDNMQI